GRTPCSRSPGLRCYGRSYRIFVVVLGGLVERREHDSLAAALDMLGDALNLDTTIARADDGCPGRLLEEQPGLRVDPVVLRQATAPWAATREVPLVGQRLVSVEVRPTVLPTEEVAVADPVLAADPHLLDEERICL